MLNSNIEQKKRQKKINLIYFPVIFGNGKDKNSVDRSHLEHCCRLQ